MMRSRSSNSYANTRKPSQFELSRQVSIEVKSHTCLQLPNAVQESNHGKKLSPQEVSGQPYPRSFVARLHGRLTTAISFLRRPVLLLCRAKSRKAISFLHQVVSMRPGQVRWRVQIPSAIGIATSVTSSWRLLSLISSVSYYCWCPLPRIPLYSNSYTCWWREAIEVRYRPYSSRRIGWATSYTVTKCLPPQGADRCTITHRYCRSRSWLTASPWSWSVSELLVM